MGEIGFPRSEFFDIRWWEVKSIIRGYNARHHAGWEQARFIAHQVHYCMGVPSGHTVKMPEEWVPFSWERQADNDQPGDIPTTDEVARLRRMMMEENARLEEENNH